ncbi:hypothetical protein CVT25_000387 [Psilocybe cyanescens]|uniref:Uncharacterized protein n=1 Tax=Psilocybe cyanescens TaxID=93625 RepID=A0A409XS51_PSICY|nr:hypothetical protein CVT25_000387 [Psilocybe cyanescens]
MCLVCTRVLKSERADRIDDRPGSQACYDSVQNEWDLCEYFATPKELAYEEDDLGFYDEDVPAAPHSYDEDKSLDSQQKRVEEFTAQRVHAYAGVVPLPAPLLNESKNGLDLIPSQAVDIVAYLLAHYGY